jgi:hypothetical protein
MYRRTTNMATIIVRMTEVRFLMTEVRIQYVNAEALIGLNPFFSLVIVPSFLGPRASINGSNKPSKSRHRNTHKEVKGSNVVIK